MPTLRAALQQGAEALGLELAASESDQLLQYLGLLQKWAKVYNLTAIHGAQDMLTRHLLDSLAVIAPLRRQLAKNVATSLSARLLDVGSGAGLPGVVIAICCPWIRVDCIDAVAKKVAFIRQVAANIGVPNLRGIHGRVEQQTGKYDVIASRAFASLADFSAWSINALAPDAVWLAMKGRRPDEELATLPPSIDVFHVEPIEVPGLNAQRCLVWMRRRSGE